ncbi:Protein NETWORKED 3A [Striga hermonthica]|uniref:Protein NETWORKED 3A n=1 Tax=Striga hermonthica TaxID=68872 RepID=A0A9N7NJI3_STRHE|nr:Protein NETWORKED 3A [Striga hermonthica]
MGQALVLISPYTFSAIGIAISIGVSVFGAVWGIYITGSNLIGAAIKAPCITSKNLIRVSFPIEGFECSLKNLFNQRAMKKGGGTSVRDGDKGKKMGGQDFIKNRKKMKKNVQRLGGKGGLSLESFANAKTRNDQYNPSLIKKQREFYKNAKYVKKYKRSLKQQEQPNIPFTYERSPESENEKKEHGHVNNKGKKNARSLEDLYKKKREEEENTRKEREALIQAKREERERVEAQRKSLKEKMYKKTRSGQPVMRYRIEHLLETIQAIRRRFEGKKKKGEKNMVELKNNGSSHWWWLDSHSKGCSIRSPWLQSTLADLDEKTRKMLKLIDEDADSFAQRAEMYYRKRPELVSMVEDFYRAHRSLAERHEQQAKSESGLARFPTQWTPQSPPLSFSKYRLDKSPSLSDRAYDSYSEARGPDFSDESEVDDPEVEDEEILENMSENEDFNKIKIERLMEEVERLREENRAQKDRLAEKDEEKREAIRQLSLAVDLLRDENTKLREHLAAKKKTRPKNEGRVEEEGFFGRFFGGLSGKLLLPAATTNLVAV